MSRLLTNRRLFVLLASFLILIVIAGLTLRGGGVFAWPERALVDTESAVGAIVYPPVSKLTGFLAGIRQLHQMYDENAQLKSELLTYQELQAKYSNAQQTIADLRTMLNFKRTSGLAYNYVPADVVGRDPSTWNAQIIIDSGLAQHVQDGMAVIGADGSLIGKVVLAGQFSAKVALITDAQLGDGVSALVQTASGKPPFGIVVGSSAVGGYLEMGFLSPLANVVAGDRVVTSGLSAQFPKGLLIGTVTKVGASSGGVTQYALIEPSADMEYLQHVFVVQASGGGR